MPCFRSLSVFIRNDNSVSLSTNASANSSHAANLDGHSKKCQYYILHAFRIQEGLHNSERPFLPWTCKRGIYSESKYDKPLWIYMQIRMYESVKASRESLDRARARVRDYFPFHGGFPGEALFPLGDRSAIRKRKRENKGP